MNEVGKGDEELSKAVGASSYSARRAGSAAVLPRAGADVVGLSCLSQRPVRRDRGLHLFGRHLGRGW